MNPRYHRSRLLPAAALLAAAALLGPSAPHARAQARLGVYTIASDEADKPALEAARKYFAGLKDDKEAQKQEADLTKGGKPPAFPNAKHEESAGAEPAVPPELVTAAAGLPQLTLGDEILAAALLARAPKAGAEPAPKAEGLDHDYRWIVLRDTEVRLLNLAPIAGTTDPGRKKILEDAGKARDAGEPFVHAFRKWVLFSRAGEEKAPQYYVLVREEPKDKALTEATLAQVRPLLDESQPALLIQFTDDGKKRLKDYTTAYAPKEGNKTSRFMVLTLDDGVLQIARIGGPIEDGRMQVGGRLTLDQVRDMAQKLQALVPVTKGS